MFTFKQKLVLSMMGVITGITLVLLIIAERKLQAAHEARFLREFNSEFALFTARQEAQLASLKAAASELSSGVRLIAILNELARDQDQDTARLVYDVIKSQLDTPGGPGLRYVPLYRAYDANGKLLDGLKDDSNERLDAQLKAVERAVQSGVSTEIGYLNLRDANGQTQLYQILLSKCIDEQDHAAKGTLLFGTPLQPSPQNGESIFGLWVENKLHVEGVPDLIQEGIRLGLTRPSGEKLAIAGKEYAFFTRQINAGSQFPPAYHVSLQPLDSLHSEKRDLRRKIAIAGTLALIAALAISLALGGIL